ncbi:MFS transporter [Rhodanobacter aciditrophus]|uniref:MFS transporter n=1 Tax=Rhodanobacter aciditrophus TaxID=1623218 RepID=A0ABW4B0U1_9GAMM
MKKNRYNTLSPSNTSLLTRIGACLAVCAALMSSGLPSPLYTHYQLLFDLSSSSISAIFSAYAVGVLSALLLNIKISRYIRNRKYLLLSGSLILIVSNIVLALASNEAALYLGRYLSGIATGTLLGAAAATLLELHPKKNPRATAVQSTVAFTLGSALGPVISGVFIQYDLSPLFWSYWVIILVALCSIPLFLLTDQWITPPKATQKSTSPTLKTRPFHLSPLFFISGLTLIIGWSVGSVLMAVGTKIAIEQVGISSALLAAALLMGFQLSAGIGQLLSGYITPKMSVTSGIALTISALALINLFSIFHAAIGFSLSVFICGFGYGISFVGATGLINQNSPNKELANNISRYYFIGYIFGNAFPAMLVGLLMDQFETSISIGLLSVWLLSITAILYFLIYKNEKAA